MPSVANPVQFNIEYYENLVSSQFRPAPNFNAWLAANLALFQDVFVCANNFDAAFDIQQAVGAQLDVLGAIIGVSRTVNFQPSNSVSPILDDPTYRIVLQAAIYKNHWGGLTSELRPIWNALFPGGVMLVTDNQNMSVNFYIAGAFTSILQDLISNDYIIPRPQGVHYVIAFATLPILGFDLDTAFIAGFDIAHFAS